MDNSKLKILERALYRERAARKQAEQILENKSAELFRLTQQLKESNEILERLVKEKTSELKGVFENIVDAYVVMDLRGNVLKMNEAAERLLECSNKTALINLLTLVHPESRDSVPKAFNTLYYEGAVTSYQVSILTKSGKKKLIDINASLIFNEQNKPIAAQGIVRDITKEKEAEKQLIESENRLATIILSLDSGVLLEDENGKIVLTNQKMCELFCVGVSPESLKGKDCTQTLLESKQLFQDPEAFTNGVTALLKNKKATLGEELLMANGTILERDYVPIYEDAVYRGQLWTFRDVTLNRSYRKSLEAQRQKYSDIIANMNLGLLEVSIEDEILMLNSSFEKMSGYTEKELIGKKGNELLLTKQSRSILSAENKERLKGKSNSYEVEVIKKNGDRRNWLISGAPNFDIKGNVIGSIGIHLDITDFKHLEQQKETLLKRLEKSNEDLQEYAHVVSHDLKSPLRSIYALVDWIREDNNDTFNDETKQNLTLINATLEKMDQLISDVLEYSSVSSEERAKDSISLNSVLEDIQQLLYIPKNFSIQVSNSLPFIYGNRARLQQLFQNLISNAIRHSNKKQGFVKVGSKDMGSHYEFFVQDNGIGIDEKHHRKIFKIFQSLHYNKASSGVGLSIVKKIVESYQGEIWLESTPNIGTTFYFTLKK